MIRYMSCLFFAAAIGCVNDRKNDNIEVTEATVEVVTVPDKILDADKNGIDDFMQSVVIGYDKYDEPFVAFMKNNPYLPAHPGWGGYGCSYYDGDMTDDWEGSCKDLVEYSLDGEVVGHAFIQIPEDEVFEGAPVDTVTGKWMNVAKSQTDYDDQELIVRHVDWSNCSLEQQELATHVGFYRVDDGVFGLGESVAPPNEDCSY